MKTPDNSASNIVVGASVMAAVPATPNVGCSEVLRFLEIDHGVLLANYVLHISDLNGCEKTNTVAIKLEARQQSDNTLVSVDTLV
jgi:hypothetical protein